MLKGKTAVVTGGTRGIGAAICRTFAQNGADVAFLYAGNVEKAKEMEEALTALGVKAKGYRCDVADSAAVKETLSQIAKEFGPVQILVNNAGVTRDKLVMGMKDADFDDVLHTNLRGAFYMIRGLYPVFMKQKYGKIINISSVSGLIGNAGQANYSASKAGLIGLTKSVARELASRHVCCNAIAPGFVETDMTKDLAEGNQLAAQIPMGRMGKPEDIAAAALFLASEGSDYITGEVIRVDGGLAM